MSVSSTEGVGSPYFGARTACTASSTGTDHRAPSSSSTR